MRVHKVPAKLIMGSIILMLPIRSGGSVLVLSRLQSRTR